MNTLNESFHTMNLRDELRELADHAVTDNPEIVAAYEHAVRYMKVRAKNGEHSCALSHAGRLSVEQLKALKKRLRDEKIEIIEHPGYDQRDLPYTELRWPK